MNSAEDSQFTYEKWHGFSNAISIRDINLDTLNSSGKLIVKKNNHEVRRLIIGGKNCYAKWFYPEQGLLSWIKFKLRAPRVFHLWNIHTTLLKEGIECPTPLLAAVNTDKTQLFICSEIEYPSMLQIFKTADTELFPELFKNAALAIAKLHNAGFIHGDCIPGNICMAQDGHCAFIDNDRTAISLSHAARERNIIQFCSHTALRKEINEAHYSILISEYNKSLGCNLEINTLLTKIQHRIQEIKRQEDNNQ